MANRQTVPALGLAGVMARRGLTGTDIQPVKRFVAPESDLIAAETLLEAGKYLANQRMKLENERLATEAAVSLKAARQAIQQAQTPEQLQKISRENEQNIAARIKKDTEGKNFWHNHGDNILTANRKDTAKMEAVKQAEFGRNSLKSLLADNQNLLAAADDAPRAMRLLDSGVEKISQTPFLNSEEKQYYRDGYLKTGIINLALNFPDEAEQAADKYFPDDKENIKTRINEMRRMNEETKQQNEAQMRRQTYLGSLQNAQILWQKKERGEITPAQFYALSADTDKDLLWADNGSRQISITPLADAYELVRRMNRGEVLSPEDVRDAGNYFITAYQLQELGLEETAELQNKMLQISNKTMIFNKMPDTAADELIDSVLMQDIPSSVTAYHPYARELMEDKARLAFEVYQVYDSKKTALVESYRVQGGILTRTALRNISQQARRETAKELELVEDTGGVSSYGELQQTLRGAYSGGNERQIWQRFLKEAPQTSDKKAFMRQIAAEEQLKELSYPQFNSYAELMDAGLIPGDKFYFQGRLAVMKG